MAMGVSLVPVHRLHLTHRGLCQCTQIHPQYETLNVPGLNTLTTGSIRWLNQWPDVRFERREVRLISVSAAIRTHVYPRKPAGTADVTTIRGAAPHKPPDGGFSIPGQLRRRLRILNCYMANHSKGHFVTAKKQRSTATNVLCCVSVGCPLTLQRGNDGQPTVVEHDDITVAQKILLRWHLCLTLEAVVLICRV